MRKSWLKIENGCLCIERNSGIEHSHYIGEVHPSYPWPEVYEIFEDEDGTKSALLNEQRAADKIDDIRRIEYELSKQN